MPSADRSFRGVFDEVAELYDRARPDYLKDVFDDIAAFADLSPGSRVLEIGCGTGQATLPLAEAGYEVVAVELGASLAAIAKNKLKSFPKVRIDVAPFEEWSLEPEPFDVVIAATAFHWIDPAIRMTKVANALRPDGVLALIDTVHIDGGTNDFFVAVQSCYERRDPEVQSGLRLPSIGEVPTRNDELDDSDLFGLVTLRRYTREIPYTAHEYIDVLHTYSGQCHLPEDARNSLYEDIETLINNEFNGHIRKAYLTELRLAKRLL